MLGFGAKKPKLPKPAELVKHIKDSLTILDKGASGKTLEKTNDEITKIIASIRLTLQGSTEFPLVEESVVGLISEIQNNAIIPLIISQMGKFDFEAKKDLIIIIRCMLNKQVGPKSATLDYFEKNLSILDSLVLGYEEEKVGVTCGNILRECFRHETLALHILKTPNIWKLFKYVALPNFDLAADAFATLKEALTRHKNIVADFLSGNYDQFFEYYKLLLHSENYVLKRQSLKLLGELLLDRANFSVMTKYIGDVENLKMIMNILRVKPKSIQFEAFHVFKVFVANPNKPQPILRILVRNKQKLIKFLQNFLPDKEEDQFNEEKSFLLKQIHALPDSV